MQTTGQQRVFAPDGRELRHDEAYALINDHRPAYQMNEFGMIYDVGKALRFVRQKPRSYVYLPISLHPEDTELDREWVLSRDHTDPGLIFFFFHPQRGPEYQLLDGNHRVEKCRLLGVPIFRAYPLAPHEIKQCEWFVVADKPCPSLHYRRFDQA
jgi:hypothetical protein